MRFPTVASAKSEQDEASLLPRDRFALHRLNSRPGVDAIEVADGFVVDLDATGKVVGIDIEHASKLLDLGTLEAEGLPLPAAGGVGKGNGQR